LGIAAAAAAAAWWLPPPPLVSSTSPDATNAPASAPANRAGSAGSEGRLASIPARASLDTPARPIFSTPAPAPVAPAAVSHAATQPLPPMPYRVAGNVVVDGVFRIALAKGERVFIVREGDVLEDGYRVDSVRADGVTLLHMTLGVRRDLQVDFTHVADPPTATAAATAAAEPGEPAKRALPAAKLRWEGPQRVREGEEFDVTLRVSAEQPVRALPVQLSYDAKLLEPIGVRPGSFFGGGKFTYHISPNGSILTGASGQAAVPSDVEAVVYSFRAIRAGASAQLAISSILIQGAEGESIGSDRPVFRTSIVP
jgi:hypothetical protein